MNEIKSLLSDRKSILVSLLFVVPAGFLTKFYNGPVAGWVNNSLCGVFYEIFWCLLITLCFRNAKPALVAFAVFIITCALEFLQLHSSPLLHYLRSFFIGRTLLGSHFTWTDFPYYAAGSAIGWGWLVGLQPRSRPAPSDVPAHGD